MAKQDTPKHVFNEQTVSKANATVVVKVGKIPVAVQEAINAAIQRGKSQTTPHGKK